MYSAAVLEVLIASPSDTVIQREIIRQAVIDWNVSNSQAYGVVLLPLMWETHSLPGLEGRPQGMINQQIVDAADILIATFWTRLGSPTGEADSGTVEEITRFRDDARPVHVYFCEIPVIPLSSDSAQIEALRNYRDGLWKAGLISSYGTNDELRIKVRDDLTKRIREMQTRGVIDSPTSTVTVHVSDSDQAYAAEAEAINLLEDTRRELRGYLASWEARYQSLDDYSIDSRHDLMHEAAASLFEVIRRIATFNPDSKVLPQLQRAAAAASNWSTYRVYMDGGRSFTELSNGLRQVLDEVQHIIDEDWD
jgi:hypothetical protein